MRKVAIISSLVGSFIIYALTIGLFNALIMFAFFGFIPGQSTRLTADQMLLFYEIISVILVVVLNRRYAQKLFVATMNRLNPKPSAPITRRRARA